MKFRMIILLVCINISLVLSGCTVNKCQIEHLRVVEKAFYTKQPITLDGKLDEPVWKQATAYYLGISKNKIKEGKRLNEPGEVRFAWDDNYFYVAASFSDSDIVAEGKQDQMFHYQLGDVCELFLKPENENYYWELYVTPAGKKTTFFYPSRGYLGLPSCFEDYKCDLKVAANCEGTLNNWHDKDKKWTAEMAMPIKDLEAVKAKFNQQVKWLVFIGRYNYSCYLQQMEHSMSPQLSETNYHLYEEYAELELVR